MTTSKRDHGGGIDAAAEKYGGRRIDWIDLSTGINPVPYPLPEISPDAWRSLPDANAERRMGDAARSFWNVPEGAEIVIAGGASALISRIPGLLPAGRVLIPRPTYNEHAAAFDMQGWAVTQSGSGDAQVVVHPNNPDGRVWGTQTLPAGDAKLTIIDESFCDVCPDESLVSMAARPGTLVLKSFGKFWGLAGLRLGFAIGDPRLIERLKDMLGPWAVAGPALEIGAAALEDHDWAEETRARLGRDSARLDALLERAGAKTVGGTTLFRLYKVDDASAWQERLARHHIWTRVFPYEGTWLRLGIPGPEDWTRLTSALA
ncbi:MAG: threonine-phosphate decarboxylase CobD [Pseudomonadota bacterium]